MRTKFWSVDTYRNARADYSASLLEPLNKKSPQVSASFIKSKINLTFGFGTKFIPETFAGAATGAFPACCFRCCRALFRVLLLLRLFWWWGYRPFPAFRGPITTLCSSLRTSLRSTLWIALWTALSTSFIAYDCGLCPVDVAIFVRLSGKQTFPASFWAA